MGFVLVMAAVLWGIGAAMKAPYRMRWAMIGMLYLGVLLVHVLPGDNPLKQATGGSLGEWLLLGGAIALIAGYRVVLRQLKARAKPKPAKQVPVGPFSASELERYARHITLREIGGPGQKRLKDAKVLVIGAGGLGSPALMYLAAAGVGTIGVIDDDEVDLSNLQRQVIHSDDRVGVPKVFSAEITMHGINPHVEVRPYHRRLTEDDARELFADYDLILDGTDNFDTRYMVNRIAVETKTPLISAAITQWEGQISLYDPAKGAPCYQCVFPKAPAPELAPSCAAVGVIGALPGVVGSMMAVEAIKELGGAGESLRGRMLFYDALYGENRQMNLKPRADCPVCSGDA
ncbi:HesA/MoeB/ThiF family protein [Actibacterium pelagium]|uniref:Molybdopterin-synthase adenylyltransferase n=1 Tax=Actibacterium pelagium TaxID=2029103 RepID=A0A917EI50_9RHOB|nr:HesA/MoeB/ThiF family protein [Actibacterium pelagium]GGE37671.1 molybdopterin biosynthesis protein [Actibacterium pelagium]